VRDVIFAMQQSNLVARAWSIKEALRTLWSYRQNGGGAALL
jgi:hypothetical protein